MNDIEEVLNYVKDLRSRNPDIKIVATNGCFDIIHQGHISMLKSAQRLGDVLIVGLNSDLSVKSLKGESRPVNRQGDRKAVLQELRCVDYVAVFEENTSHKFLEAVKPNVYVKAGDYSLESLNSLEKEVLVNCGTEIKFTYFISGLSTTNILKKINEQTINK